MTKDRNPPTDGDSAEPDPREPADIGTTTSPISAAITASEANRCRSDHATTRLPTSTHTRLERAHGSKGRTTHPADGHGCVTVGGRPVPRCLS